MGVQLPRRQGWVFLAECTYFRAFLSGRPASSVTRAQLGDFLGVRGRVSGGRATRARQVPFQLGSLLGRESLLWREIAPSQLGAQPIEESSALCLSVADEVD